MPVDVYLVTAIGWAKAARPRYVAEDREGKIRETPGELGLLPHDWRVTTLGTLGRYLEWRHAAEFRWAFLGRRYSLDQLERHEGFTASRLCRPRDASGTRQRHQTCSAGNNPDGCAWHVARTLVPGRHRRKTCRLQPRPEGICASPRRRRRIHSTEARSESIEAPLACHRGITRYEAHTHRRPAREPRSITAARRTTRNRRGVVGRGEFVRGDGGDDRQEACAQAGRDAAASHRQGPSAWDSVGRGPKRHLGILRLSRWDNHPLDRIQPTRRGSYGDPRERRHCGSPDV